MGSDSWIASDVCCSSVINVEISAIFPGDCAAVTLWLEVLEAARFLFFEEGGASTLSQSLYQSWVCITDVVWPSKRACELYCFALVLAFL